MVPAAQRSSVPPETTGAWAATAKVKARILSWSELIGECSFHRWVRVASPWALKDLWSVRLNAAALDDGVEPALDDFLEMATHAADSCRGCRANGTLSLPPGTVIYAPPGSGKTTALLGMEGAAFDTDWAARSIEERLVARLRQAGHVIVTNQCAVLSHGQVSSGPRVAFLPPVNMAQRGMTLVQAKRALQLVRDKAHVLVVPAELRGSDRVFLSNALALRETQRAIEFIERDLKNMGMPSCPLDNMPFPPEHVSFDYQASIYSILDVEKLEDLDRPLHLRTHTSTSERHQALALALKRKPLADTNDAWRMLARDVNDALDSRTDVADEIWLGPGGGFQAVEGISLEDEEEALAYWTREAQRNRQTSSMRGPRLALSPGFCNRYPALPTVPVVPPPEWASGRIPSVVAVAPLLDYKLCELGIRLEPVRWFFRPRSIMPVQEWQRMAQKFWDEDRSVLT